MGELPQAVLFDCDGTLADTEPISAACWAEALAERGYHMTEADARAVLGHPFVRSFAHYADKVELGDPARFREELRQRFGHRIARELVLHDDAIATLRALVGFRVPVAVVSSSSRGHVRRILEQGGVVDQVGLIVGADDVAEHKPSPVPYRAAAEQLEVDPAGCTVVEDTATGIAAGVAAGCYVVGVQRSHNDLDELRAADRIVSVITVAAVVPQRTGLPDSGRRRAANDGQRRGSTDGAG